jgi:hypothetical protein
MLSCVCVTVDGVLDWILDFLATYTHIAITDLHNSQITTAPAKPFPAYCVFTSCSLVTASNSGDSLASALKSSLNGRSLPGLFQLSLFYTASHTELTWLAQLPSL